MLAVSIQCWRMVRALRSHGRCWLVVSYDEMSPYTLVLELPLWLTVGWSWLVNHAVRPERSLRLLSNVLFCEVVDNKTAGPLKRPSSSTIASLHDITGSFASSYKSHRLPTCLRPLHYVVLLHDFNVSFKVLSLLSRIALLAVVPWRHHLVMILWLNSQQNRFLRC